eukprot:2605696-Pleurochrysis_carterae.AAC.3
MQTKPRESGIETLSGWLCLAGAWLGHRVGGSRLRPEVVTRAWEVASGERPAGASAAAAGGPAGARQDDARA